MTAWADYKCRQGLGNSATKANGCKDNGRKDTDYREQGRALSAAPSALRGHVLPDASHYARHYTSEPR